MSVKKQRRKKPKNASFLTPLSESRTAVRAAKLASSAEARDKIAQQLLTRYFYQLAQGGVTKENMLNMDKGWQLFCEYGGDLQSYDWRSFQFGLVGIIFSVERTEEQGEALNRVFNDLGWSDATWWLELLNEEIEKNGMEEIPAGPCPASIRIPRAVHG